VLRWRACSCPVFLLSLSPSPFADYTVLLLQLGRQQHLPATPASRNMSDRMDNHEQRETMHKLDDDDAPRANMLRPATSTMLESSPRKSLLSLNQDSAHPSQSKVRPHSEVVDDASDSDGADSVFSQSSLASPATSLGGISAPTNDLITNLTSDLLCTEEMHAVNSTALKDQSMGPERYRRNVRRLIKLFGQDFRAEAKDSIQMMAARALQKRPISAHAALGTRKTFGGLAQCPR
jgi:hypothetical protein